MADEKRIRISNESLNCYGTWVMTDGVDMTQYLRNPVLLQMHWRGYIIGSMMDIKVENGEITGVPYFDEVREESKLAKQQWDKGTLRMCSPNFDVLEWSEDAIYLKQGQTRATVVKCKLVEVSMVDIGGNDDNIVMLSHQGNGLQLAAGDDCPNLPLLKSENKGSEPTIDNLNKKEMKTIALKLGLPETATQDDILSEISLLQGFKSANVTLRAEKEELQLAAITREVDAAVAARKITADRKDHFIKLGKSTGIETLKLTFESMAVAMKPTDVINPSTGAAGMQLAGDYKKLSDVPADKLMQLRNEDKATYMKLYKAEYGVDCPALS